MNKEALTLKQRRFCEYYLETGNGTEAVIKAGYKIKGNMRLASVIASENLRKPNISTFISLKLERLGFDDTSIKKHHLFLISQFADLSVKAKAIDMYYKLKGTYAPKRHQLEEKIETVQIISYADSLK